MGRCTVGCGPGGCCADGYCADCVPECCPAGVGG